MIPGVIDEFETLRTIIRQKASISRFGDGELKLITGQDCKVQVCTPKVQERLRQVLCSNVKGLLICIPRVYGRRDLFMQDYKRWRFWETFFQNGKHMQVLNKHRQYYSAFITRADAARHICCDDYWELFKKIWNNRSVVILTGSSKFKQNIELFKNTKSLTYVYEPDIIPQNSAFERYEDIMELAKRFNKQDLLLLSIGPTATVMAHDLHLLGYHALDVGHLEMSYRRCYSSIPGIQREQLISPYYRIQSQLMTEMGGSGDKWAETVSFIIKQRKLRTLLDYGCGKGTLKEALKDFGLEIFEYDPAIPGKDLLPDRQYDIIVCTDVLEHVEPGKIDNVIDHIYYLCKRVAFFVVSLKKSDKNLPDGQNTHLIIKDEHWWIGRIIGKRGWDVEKFPTPREKDVALICVK